MRFRPRYTPKQQHPTLCIDHLIERIRRERPDPWARAAGIAGTLFGSAVVVGLWFALA
jgi:hypothetical protein